VSVREHVNARYLAETDLPEEWRRFDLVTVDVSFISLRFILPVIPSRLAADGDVIRLVKPQFEAGRGEVGKRGVVRDETVRQRVLQEVTAAARAVGLTLHGSTPSPIEGMEGNVEWLAHFRHTALH
jgi:23S rRNA (cytidine1920-2'-O)/16S rRNA (cytidine1409-2'-O)-methyltransferase